MGTIGLTARQYALLQRADLWQLVDKHGSILRAAAREPEHADELGALNAAALVLLRATKPPPGYEARVRGAVRKVLRDQRRADAQS
jgi:hypothetical protein